MALTYVTWHGMAWYGPRTDIHLEPRQAKQERLPHGLPLLSQQLRPIQLSKQLRHRGAWIVWQQGNRTEAAAAIRQPDSSVAARGVKGACLGPCIRALEGAGHERHLAGSMMGVSQFEFTCGLELSK